MQYFVWAFAILYAIQIVFGIGRVAEGKGISLTHRELAVRTIYKVGVFTWAVYLLSR